MEYILPEKEGGIFFSRGQSTYCTDRTSTSLSKTALLQLDFPAFLRERTRATKTRGEAIAIRVPTNAIALTSFFATVNLSGASRNYIMAILSNIASKRTCKIHP